MPRFAAITALSSTLILSSAGAAFADPAPDVTPPVIRYAGLNPGQLVGHGKIFYPSVTDDIGVVAVEILVNGVLRATLSEVGGQHEFFSARTDFTGIEQDGDTDVTVRPVDAAGNRSEVTVRVHADVTFPTATISPAVGTTVNGITTITATDVPADVTKISFSYGGTPLSTATAAPWTFPWDTTDPRAPSGVVVTVEDLAKNITRYGLKYKIDNTGPKIWATTNWIPEVIGPGVGHAAVAYGENPDDVARVEWWVDGVLRSTTQIAEIDFGQVSRTADVEVRGFDALGNVTVLNRKIRVDATSPTVTSVTPANGALVRGDKLWTEFKATDASGISGGEVGYLGSEQFAVAVKSPYRVSLPVLGDGRMEWNWRVSDRFGNVTVVRRVVTVDNTDPLLKVTKAPKNGAKVKGTVQITASAWDRNGIARAELLINGKVVARDYAAAYKFSVNTKKYGKKIKVQIRAYDKAGNVTSTSIRTWKR